MRRHPDVYGHEEEDWYRFRYIDLLRSQDPLQPMVKPFDLSISVGGVPETAARSAEFFDWVSILRQISTERDRVRRVMVYLSLALEGEEMRARSAEHFSSQEHRLWAQALAYLHDRREATCIDASDLVVMHANGSMRPCDVRKVKDDFNVAPADDKIHVLCSCQVFAEGITLERVDLTQKTQRLYQKRIRECLEKIYRAAGGVVPDAGISELARRVDAALRLTSHLKKTDSPKICSDVCWRRALKVIPHQGPGGVIPH